MASESQSAIDVLRADNERLTKDLAKATSERDKHAADLASITAERDGLKKASAEAEQHKARAEAAEQQVRMLRHRGEFAKIAKAHGAHEEAIEDLYEHSRYKADKDDPDPKVFETLITDLKAKKAYCFQPDEPEREGRPAEDSRLINGAAPKPVPAQARGTAHRPESSGIKITKAQLQDPKFMLDPKNKAAIADAAKNGRFIR